MRHDVSLLTLEDVRRFREGTHCRLQDKLGGRTHAVDGASGALFAVWAPAAASVSLVGDFNDWDPAVHPLRNRNDGSGVWEIFVEGVAEGALYKFHLRDLAGYAADRVDPFARAFEAAPGKACVLRDPDRDWQDHEWQARQAVRSAEEPLSIYEVHLDSWQRVPEEGNRVLTYEEAAERLANYLLETGFTHVELLPLTERAEETQLGRDAIGWFAPAARFGPPEAFMAFVDVLHRRGLGVLMDWPAGALTEDPRGLLGYDGGPLFERPGSRVFNYARGEVRSFLLSSALHWLERFHLDGLRLSPAGDMLYLDRAAVEWTPNMHGGRENLEAVAFLRSLSDVVQAERPGALLMTDATPALPATAPVIRRGQHGERGLGVGDLGGLGFSLAWNLAWRGEVLGYLGLDPLFRKGRHDMLAAVLDQAFAERFVLPLSHEEVQGGRGSLFARMAGDDWRKLASLRLLYALAWACPGQKLLFMGQEFGQSGPWRPDRSLDWSELAHDPKRQGLRHLVQDLNRLRRTEAALGELDFRPEGFEWIDFRDAEASVLSFLRYGLGGETVLAAFNFTPVPRPNYRLGVPGAGFWREILNSDARLYGGGGWGNMGGVASSPAPMHGRFDSLSLTLPPLGAVYLKLE